MSEGGTIFPMVPGTEVTGMAFHILHRMIFVRKLLNNDLVLGTRPQPVDWDSGETYNTGDIVHAAGECFAWKGLTPGNYNPTAGDGNLYWFKSVGDMLSSWMANHDPFYVMGNGEYIMVSELRPPIVWAGELQSVQEAWTERTWKRGEKCGYRAGGKWYKPIFDFLCTGQTTSSPMDGDGNLNENWRRHPYFVEISPIDRISTGVGAPYDKAEKVKLSYQAAVERICDNWGGARGAPVSMLEVYEGDLGAIEPGRSGLGTGSFIVAAGAARYVSEVESPDTPPPGSIWHQLEESEVVFNRIDPRYKCMSSAFEKCLGEIGDFDMCWDPLGYPSGPPMAPVCGLGADCPELAFYDPEEIGTIAWQQFTSGRGDHDVHPVWRRCWHHTMSNPRWRRKILYEVGKRVTCIDDDNKVSEHECMIEHLSTIDNRPDKNNREIDPENGLWSIPDGDADGYNIAKYWYVQSPTYINGYVWGTWDQLEENHDNARFLRHAHDEIPAALMNDMYSALLCCDTGSVDALISDWLQGDGFQESKEAAIAEALASAQNKIDLGQWTSGAYYAVFGFGVYTEWNETYEKYSAYARCLRITTSSDLLTTFVSLGIPYALEISPWFYEIYTDTLNGSRPSVTAQNGLVFLSATWHGYPTEAHCKSLESLNLSDISDYKMILKPVAQEAYTNPMNSALEQCAQGILKVNWDTVAAAFVNV